MMRVSKILPQFSRFISAKSTQKRLYILTTIGLFSTAVSIGIVNIFQMKQYVYSKEVTSLIKQPFSPQQHVILAKSYKNTRQNEYMNREIVFIQDLIATNKTESVLGASTDIQRTLDVWNAEPSQLETKLEYWKSIISQHPEYRDAYLQAAYIAKLLHKDNTAKTYMQQAESLDPQLIHNR